MRTALTLILLLTACFSLATYLQPRQASRELLEHGQASALDVLLGDGRRLFANEIFAKADAYFHRGNYPSIFELNARREENHMTAAAAGEEEHYEGDGHDHGDEGHDEHGEHEEHGEHRKGGGHGSEPRDWIEAFGRHLHPSVHLHLRDGEEREMLPWLQLSARLNPRQVEAYAVAAYWLRRSLNKVDEAEQFLREGLRHNPGDPLLLHEMARLEFHNRKNYKRAENLWIAALKRWRETEAGKEEPNEFLLSSILGGLAQLNIEQGELTRAIDYFRQLKEVSPLPEAVQRRIDELTEKLKAGEGR